MSPIPPPDSPKAEMVVHRREQGAPLTPMQRENLAELAARAGREVDASEIGELPMSAWKNAVRGKLYRPVKQAVSLRLDADVIAWLKKDGQGYQTRVNQMRREQMLRELDGR